MFPLLSPCFFFFSKSFSLNKTPSYVPRFVRLCIFSQNVPHLLFVLVSLLSNLYFFSFSRPQILYSFVPSFLSCPLIFLSVCLLYLKSLYILH
jgi:hypothetical protein